MQICLQAACKECISRLNSTCSSTPIQIQLLCPLKGSIIFAAPLPMAWSFLMERFHAQVYKALVEFLL